MNDMTQTQRCEPKYGMALFVGSDIAPRDISEQLGILMDFISSVHIDEGHHHGLVIIHKIISDTLMLLSDRLNKDYFDRLMNDQS